MSDMKKMFGITVVALAVIFAGQSVASAQMYTGTNSFGTNHYDYDYDNGYPSHQLDRRMVTIRGTVLLKRANELQLQDGRTVYVHVDNRTDIYNRNGKPIRFAKIRVGDSVVVRGWYMNNRGNGNSLYDEIDELFDDDDDDTIIGRHRTMRVLHADTIRDLSRGRRW